MSAYCRTLDWRSGLSICDSYLPLSHLTGKWIEFALNADRTRALLSADVTDLTQRVLFSSMKSAADFNQRLWKRHVCVCVCVCAVSNGRLFDGLEELLVEATSGVSVRVDF